MAVETPRDSDTNCESTLRSGHLPRGILQLETSYKFITKRSFASKFNTDPLSLRSLTELFLSENAKQFLTLSPYLSLGVSMVACSWYSRP